MIFFNIPSVGHLKPETLFGNDDHFGFIQTLIGEIYSPQAIGEKCQQYYNKTDDNYWGRIITLINFLGLKKIDEQNRISAIPALSYISEQFDKNNNLPSKILFDYLLCQWQYPHPILTANRLNRIPELNLEITNQRRNYPICKPYSVILSILLNLFQENHNDGFLTNEEFYWLGYEYHRKQGQDFNIDNIGYWVEEIKKIRRNGWNLFAEIENKGVHLTYPKGFLKNSSVLTDDYSLYNNNDDFFIGLKRSSLIESKVTSLINESFSIFEFDRSISERNTNLGFEFSNYLYNTNTINSWIQSVEIHKDCEFQIANDNLTQLLDETHSEYKVRFLLQRISNLDKETVTKRRSEQYLLRNYLLGQNEYGKCAICNEEFPISFLAAAHIKKRSYCTDIEKRNYNIVMPTCYLGCDKLYEDGYVIVKEGKVKSNINNKERTAAIESYIENISENN